MAGIDTSMTTESPFTGASPFAINLECGFGASSRNGRQEAAVSFCTAGGAEEEDLALSKAVACSSSSNSAAFVLPRRKGICSQLEAPAVSGNIGKCVISHQPLDNGKGSCNPANPSMGLEDTYRTETQPTKGVQICAICHEKIKRQETAEIKGCEHSYCVTCILRWATYKTEPWCPQCRLPFSFLYVYRALDGSLSDYLFEESVCLLLRAFWFKPLVVQEPEERDDYQDDYDAYDNDAYEEPYYTSNVRLGNRRWGDSGYVRAGRREARPVGVRQGGESGGSSSRQAKGKEPAKEAVGRRARRTQKREQLDKVTGKK